MCVCESVCVCVCVCVSGGISLEKPLSLISRGGQNMDSHKNRDSNHPQI